MAIYCFGPDPGRVISQHESSADDCTVRDRNRELIPHKHVVVVFGEDAANEIAGQTLTVCDFQLRADGGWAEVEEAVAAALVTTGKGPKPAKKSRRK